MPRDLKPDKLAKRYAENTKMNSEQASRHAVEVAQRLERRKRDGAGKEHGK